MIAYHPPVWPPRPPVVPKVCHAGVYGLAGDWGPGSMLADTGQNRAIIRLRFPLRAERIILHVRPLSCGGRSNP